MILRWAAVSIILVSTLLALYITADTLWKIVRLKRCGEPVNETLRRRLITGIVVSIGTLVISTMLIIVMTR